MNKTQISALLFFLVALLNLAGYGFSIDVLANLSKPFLMILLSIYLYLSVIPQKSGKVIYISLGALVFSWLGDNFLMFSSIAPAYFMLGLGSFLIAQVFYVIVFQMIRFGNKKGISLVTLIWIAVVLIYSIDIWVQLKPFLGNYMIPVTAYLIVISIMAMSAASRFGKTNTGSFLLCYTGALLFMISDTVIAINKWHHLIVNERLIVMTTYILAQWMIINGIIIHFRSQPVKGA